MEVGFKVQHSWKYRRRRGLNWFFVGLAYAFFYMGRYNMTVFEKTGAISAADFGWIFGVGAWAYGISFLLSGPVVDRWGGRAGMLWGTIGTIAVNLVIGLLLYGKAYGWWSPPMFWTLMALYALNMHFQSFGAISIVTVKAPWFHVNERGTFSMIFGWMISLGIFFAFDLGFQIMSATRANVDPGHLKWFASMFQAMLGTGTAGVNQDWWLFFTPAILLSGCWIAMLIWLRDTPGQAGFDDFDTGEEVLAGSESAPLHPREVLGVFWRIVTHPVLFWVCLVELCSGVLRNGIMHWYRSFMKATGNTDFFVYDNWGACLLACGVIGAWATGHLSDWVFNSRRAPVATIFYAMIFVAAVVMIFTIDSPNLWFLGSMTLVISMAVIGVHGIFSGTATADFAGARKAGAATGVVDGIVYLGAGIQSVVIGWILIPDDPVLKADPANWISWPIFLVPFALAGIFFASRIWNARPAEKPAGEPTEPNAKVIAPAKG